MQNNIQGLRVIQYVEYEPIKKEKERKGNNNTSSYWHRLITHQVQTKRFLRTSKPIKVPTHLSDTEATRVC